MAVTIVRTASSSQIGSLLTQASASTTYLTQTSASTIYAPIVPTTQTGFKNAIINGDFRINQRVYPSASNLASGSYGFDRWKSNFTNTTLTFTSAPQGQTLTINSGGGLEQVVERANMPAGTYVLSWTGTATGRVYNTGATPPSYAASPIIVNIDGTANVEVEFTASGGTRTLYNVQLEKGSTATPFESRPIVTELTLCQRYYQTSFSGSGVAPGHNASGNGIIYHPGVSGGISGNIYTNIRFPFMRVSPSVNIWNGNNASATPATASLTGGLNTSASGMKIYTAGGVGYDSASIGIDYIRNDSISLYAQASTGGAASGILAFGYSLNAEL
jgi:hypothetical protein